MKLQITETITHEVDIDIDKLKKLFEAKGWELENGRFRESFYKGTYTATVSYDLIYHNQRAIQTLMRVEHLSYSQFIKELNEI